MNQTSPHHHLPRSLLTAYSAGTLPEAFDLVVAAHVSLCDECRAELGEQDAIGAAVLDTCEPQPVAADAFEKLMAGLADVPVANDAPKVASRGAVLPQPVQDYTGGDVETVRWRSIGGGVRQCILVSDKAASVRLLYIPAGARVPDHTHAGTEMTLVLRGAFRDEFMRFARGDVEVANEQHHHHPIAEEWEDCICLAASDGPMVFDGLLPRIAQRFNKM